MSEVRSNHERSSDNDSAANTFERASENGLEILTEANTDIYMLYRELYGIWCSNNAAVPEPIPLFRIPGIEPDGTLSITDDFRHRVRSLAAEILPLFSKSEKT